MRRSLAVAAVLACAWCAAIPAASAPVEDWPQWRGPRGDGISREPLTSPWPATGLKKLWSATVGMGYSSPIAIQGTLYLFMANGIQDQLFAFSAATGKQLWKSGYDATPFQDGGYRGTRATPTFENGKIYTYGGGGDLVAWDVPAGGPSVVWRINILKELGVENLGWGEASSPLIVGNRLFVQGGNAEDDKAGPVAVGVNKKTGRIEWRAEEKGLSSYAHTILADVGGAKQLVVFGGKEVYGISPDTGKTLWKEPWETPYDINAATPLYRDGYLMVSSGYGHGAMMLRLSATGATKMWESKDLASRFPALVLDGDYVYGNSEGKLKCLHWPDGKQVWEENLKLNEGGSILRAGDKLIVLSQRGKLFLLKTDGPKLERLSEMQVFDADFVWSTPLLYDGRLYLKGSDELICYDLGSK